jgi:alkanesulfonate monooxygenase SsuD/methylene tetrahydromethanopterin reductase-like flavin-dependent oxidoreductase (luciferase family)
MLRLTAALADAWNTCWLARAKELPERLAPMWEACEAVGRDPSTLEVTVGQLVTFPGMPEEQDFNGRRARFEFTGPEDLANEWRAFAEQGVGHLIIWKTPHTVECHNLLAAALRHYREGEPE